MTSTSPSHTTDHIAQICRERSERGVATRADWQRLAELNPDRAHAELKSYLQLLEAETPANPYEKRSGFRLTGLAAGFFVGVLFMVGWWLFGEYLHENVVTSTRGWDVVTLTQYIAASLLPAFAFLGWKLESRRFNKSEEAGSAPNTSLRNATWEELLARFDATRKAGGTRMY